MLAARQVTVCASDPIELAFAKFKALLRKAAERSVRSLWRPIGSLIPKLTP
jgi:hypothetical protein